MSKKFIPVILVMTFAGLFVAYNSKGNVENEDPKERHNKILRNVGILLKEGHYSPKPIDDNFSKEIFIRFLEELDDDKNIFYQSDIDNFKAFEKKMDDEINGQPLTSFYAINEIYIKRLNEVSVYPSQLLSKPFDFTKDEAIQLDAKKKGYPRSEAERIDSWRKRIKYLVLSRYVDVRDEREKNKGKVDYVAKADTTLERESREYVRKTLDRFFTTRKTRETTDENFSTFINAITGQMDPHTNYFPPADLRSFNESMSGHFYGIGAQLKEEDGRIKIGVLTSGGPAWKSGELMENDEIIKVGQGDKEPVDVTGYSVPDAVKLIRGSEKGTEVRLTVRRTDGSIKVIKLLRDEIKLEDTFVKSAIINGQFKIGYIYLPEFYADFEKPDGPRCATDVARELTNLKAENVDGIIIDLRGNGGGSLYDVVKMAGLFIEDGPICQVKGRDEVPNVLQDIDKSVLYGGPLAVMVDETSASASEIFAAAIQDYKRGITLGSTSTYGKGTVQRNIDLNPSSENRLFAAFDKKDELGSVKLTLQKFYRINGGATQLKGVTPDIIMPDRLEHLKFREKDNPVALKWDEIKKADYKIWESHTGNDEVISTAIAEIARSGVFSKIKSNVQWLEKYGDKEYSLHLNKFTNEQKQLKSIYKELDSLYKLKAPLKIAGPQKEVALIKDDKDKKDKLESWLKRLSEDIFIDESVKVLNKMITQNKTAKFEK